MTQTVVVAAAMDLVVAARELVGCRVFLASFAEFLRMVILAAVKATVEDRLLASAALPRQQPRSHVNASLPH